MFENDNLELPALNKTNRFETAVLTHLDAAYNLARWLMRHDQDAEDVVQEACMRAFRYFDSFNGSDGKAWLLSIVRNTCYSRFQHNKQQPNVSVLDEEHDQTEELQDAAEDPEALLARFQDIRQLSLAIAALPVEFREVLVLRELEDLSYKIIADIAAVPIGTVMSRLSRARVLLRRQLKQGGLGV